LATSLPGIDAGTMESGIGLLVPKFSPRLAALRNAYLSYTLVPLKCSTMVAPLSMQAKQLLL